MRSIDEDRCLRVTWSKFASQFAVPLSGLQSTAPWRWDDVLRSPGACPSGACAIARGLEASVVVSRTLDSSLTGGGRIVALPLFGPYIIKQYKSKWNTFLSGEEGEWMKVKENNASNTEIKQRQREHHGIYRHNENLHSKCYFFGRKVGRRMLPNFCHHYVDIMSGHASPFSC